MMRQRLVQVLRSVDDVPNMDTVVRRFWSSAEAPRPHLLGRHASHAGHADPTESPSRASRATDGEGRQAQVVDLVPRLKERAAARTPEPRL